MMVPLCSTRSCFLPVSSAYLNANLRTLSEASRVMSFTLCATPSMTRCSMPEYSPSVFSRMSNISTFSYGVLYPTIDLQGLTLAKRLKVLRRVRFNETCHFPTGVANGPFKATPFLRILSMAGAGMGTVPSTKTGVISIGSHLMGTFAAAKIS